MTPPVLDRASPERAGVVPLLLGPKNCELMTGLPWRFVRDHARELGIAPLKVGKKLCVPADAFMRALQGVTVVESDAVELADPAAALRARLGLHLVAANDAQRITNAPLLGRSDAETASLDASLPSRKPRRAAG